MREICDYIGNNFTKERLFLVSIILMINKYRGSLEYQITKNSWDSSAK